jgi:U3 small nucleolar RNA-associated protein 13
MEHPRRLYNLFNAVSSTRTTESIMDAETGEILETYELSSITGNPAVDEVVRTLPQNELLKLIRHVRDWNATARTSTVAQLVLHAIVKLRPAGDIQAAFGSQKQNSTQDENAEGGKLDVEIQQGDGLREVLDALIPYTERHLARTDRLVQDSYILDFLLGEMDGGVEVFDEGDDQ